MNTMILIADVFQPPKMQNSWIFAWEPVLYIALGAAVVGAVWATSSVIRRRKEH